ncbi:MAG: cytochrome c oxidase subunit II, partial [Acidimicrobiia bacterium]
QARKINDLFWLVFWIATVIFVLVSGVLLYSVIRFRQRKGRERPVKQIHGNTRLEVVWTIIPAVLLAFVAVPTVLTIFDLRETPTGDVLNVRVTGHQWWWEFEYPDLEVVTANELHIPAGRPVYLTMTSADVIHSFWVPQLNGKRDVVPGRETNLTLFADEPGLYLGQCAEFCGLGHADMRVQVLAEVEADFQAWAAGQAQPAVIPEVGPAAEGWQVFQLVCTACHAINGTDFQARFAPDLTHIASRTTFAAATLETNAENLKEWLADPPELKPMSPHLNDLNEGRILGMPNYELSSEEIDSLVALLMELE